jgi:hypothetical protein
LSAYRRASGRELVAERIVANTVFDLLIVWEFGRRPEQGWFPPESTFGSSSEASLRAVRDALDWNRGQGLSAASEPMPSRKGSIVGADKASAAHETMGERWAGSKVGWR